MLALLVIGGLLALIAGAELVVRYGSLLARRLGVPPMIIGLTIVSIGTSAPELAVGIDAMKVNAGSLAVGNIAGTNIVNLLLILGLSAAMRTIDFERRTLVLDLPGMAVAAALVYLLSLDGQLQFWEGVPLVFVAVAYTVLLGWWTRREHLSKAVQIQHDVAVEARVTGSGRAQPPALGVVPAAAAGRHRRDRRGCRLAGQGFCRAGSGGRCLRRLHRPDRGRDRHLRPRVGDRARVDHPR